MRLARVIFALFALAAPSLAFAQATILQGGPWQQGRVPMYVGNGFSQPVVQDSGPAGGGGAGVGLSELGVTARGNGTPPYAAQGTGPYGTNVCDFDAPTTGPYHYLCFSANAQGGPLIAAGAAGGASSLPLSCIVNGVSTGCLGSGSPALTIGSTGIVSGTPGALLFNNGGVLGNAGGVGFVFANGASPITFKPALPLNPGVSQISPSTNGGVLWDNAGVLADTTTLPSGLTIPNATLTGVTIGSNLNFQTVGDPATIVFTPPAFGGAWLTQNQLTSTYASAHTDGRATLNVARSAIGSGQNGPGTADYSAFFTAQKTNYLTSLVEGEIDGGFCLTAQGSRGDTACMLGQAIKVFGGVSPTGGVLGNQLQVQWINSSGQALMNINTIEAFGEGAGGQSNNTGYGWWAESSGAVNAVAGSQITPFSAYYADALDPNGNCPSQCPTWTNALTFAGSAAASDIFFNVAWGVNQSGKITLGSGNATGKDGNPTLSGGVRLALENNGGTFVVLDASGNNLGQLTQAGAWVVGATAHTTGKLQLVGSTSGVVTLAAQNIAGSPSDLFGTTSGTLASSATTPLAINATTGVATCATCATTTNGGAITGTAPVAVSAAGAISITGAAGQVLAGATPAFTATPVLGASGTLGSLGFGNASSGIVTVQPVAGALGTVTASLPANTGTLAETNLAQTWSALQTYSALVALTPVTISTLLAITCNSASEGDVAFVKDTVGSAAATFHLTVAGAGATTVNSLASCNGSNWQYD